MKNHNKTKIKTKLKNKTNKKKPEKKQKPKKPPKKPKSKQQWKKKDEKESQTKINTNDKFICYFYYIRRFIYALLVVVRREFGIAVLLNLRCRNNYFETYN